jgi:hypothetical protein
MSFYLKMNDMNKTCNKHKKYERVSNAVNITVWDYTGKAIPESVCAQLENAISQIVIEHGYLVNVVTT